MVVRYADLKSSTSSQSQGQTPSTGASTATDAADGQRYACCEQRVCMCACMCVCVCVCMYVCMYVSMAACLSFNSYDLAHSWLHCAEWTARTPNFMSATCQTDSPRMMCTPCLQLAAKSSTSTCYEPQTADRKVGAVVCTCSTSVLVLLSASRGWAYRGHHGSVYTHTEGHISAYTYMPSIHAHTQAR